MKLPTIIETGISFDPKSFYRVTNEEPEHFIEALDKLAPNVPRAGGICSAGEVPLFVLLPRADEVTVIDHAKGSLAVTLAKCAALTEVGPDEFCALLQNDQTKWIDLINGCAAALPPPFRPPITGYYNKNILNSCDAPGIWAAWSHLVKFNGLAKAVAKLDKLTLIHGDLADLPGEFDLLYISNALEHTGRSGKAPDCRKLHAQVKKGGYLIMTGGSSGDRAIYDQTSNMWKLVWFKHSARTQNWRYQIWERV